MSAGAAAAVRLALDLMHVPSRVKFVREQPLPDGVQILLRIAAGEDDAISEAAVVAARSETDIKRAAAFFIEQLMFATAADSYRVLGASRAASSGELRRNMALLLRWLHPDTNSAHNALYAGRVTRAWEDLKTAERRQAYDDQRRVHEQLKAAQSTRRRSSRRTQANTQARTATVPPLKTSDQTEHGHAPGAREREETGAGEQDVTASLREAMRNLFADRKE